MDVGVPKDDSLNQIEFGYGSIKYSTGPYFKKLGQTMPDFEEHAQNSTTAKPTVSDMTVVELHDRSVPVDLHSADESSKMSSCSVTSVFDETGNGAIPQRPSAERIQTKESKASSGGSSKSSDVSLTESEIQRALGEAGFDMEATQDIVKIIKDKGHRRGKRTSTSTEPNNNKPFNSDPNVSGLPKRLTSQSSYESI